MGLSGRFAMSGGSSTVSARQRLANIWPDAALLLLVAQAPWFKTISIVLPELRLPGAVASQLSTSGLCNLTLIGIVSIGIAALLIPSWKRRRPSWGEWTVIAWPLLHLL